MGYPTFLGALQAFNAYEPRYDVLPGPGNNRTAASYLADGRRKPKFGYCMPEFQNPTGLTLDLAERGQLLDLSDALNLPLRLPTMIAKSVASLDSLSGGRVELGLGAGAFWDAVAAMGGLVPCPILTVAPVMKPPPVMVMAVPPVNRPDLGLTAVTVGTVMFRPPK